MRTATTTNSPRRSHVDEDHEPGEDHKHHWARIRTTQVRMTTTTRCQLRGPTGHPLPRPPAPRDRDQLTTTQPRRWGARAWGGPRARLGEDPDHTGEDHAAASSAARRAIRWHGRQLRATTTNSPRRSHAGEDHELEEDHEHHEARIRTSARRGAVGGVIGVSGVGGRRGRREVVGGPARGVVPWAAWVA